MMLNVCFICFCSKRVKQRLQIITSATRKLLHAAKPEHKEIAVASLNKTRATQVSATLEAQKAQVLKQSLFYEKLT